MASIEDQGKLDRRSKKDTVREAHLQALDDLVSVNSLFTIAVFVGLSMAARGQKSLETRKECQAGINYAKMLLLYEVVAFACFILSSLVAKVLKFHIIIFYENHKFIKSERLDLKEYMLILAATSSVAGIVFLTLSVINIIQIRVGLLSCGSKIAWWATCSLGVIVGHGLVIYVISMAIGIYVSFQSDKHRTSEGHQTKPPAKVLIGNSQLTA